ncbi:hypothetical protein FNH05_23370 [Amycolatopsis rhizosphaerae]|uniref:Uncharacterized protein n=1 Tax=Amycolatopsis rhizosphaerae TaxID=2053003 RepID=A0A558BW90_9PSEU|nr:hypothetical protein [Amycolatopsis rhizosphaerae]TVT40790.1 hypothetical protein FNH05_23370 [Amycolatopsis rhizosphaerae]
MTRLLGLYLRSRRVPVALPAAVIATAVVSVPGAAGDDPQRTLVFTVFALALGVSVLGNGLGGAHETLERTAAVPWARWRSGHLVAIAVTVCAVASLTSGAPAGTVIRDAAGLAGLTALASAAFGHQLAWTLPLAWAGTAAVVPPVAQPVLLHVLTWPLQPPDAPAATVVAAALAATGLVTYAVRGSRPVDHPPGATASGDSRCPA